MGCSVSASRWLPFVALLAGCGTTAPGAVDVEGAALDLDACIRGDASCVKTGDVGASETFFAGDHDLSLVGRPGAPSSISLPLQRVDGGNKLRWLALGVYAENTRVGTAANGDPIVSARFFTVSVDGLDPIRVTPTYGYSRIEVDTHGLKPAAGARVKITADEGKLVLIYAAGRWDE